MRKEYMGEFALPVIDWFEGGDVKLWSDSNPVSHQDILEFLQLTESRQFEADCDPHAEGIAPPAPFTSRLASSLRKALSITKMP